MTDNFCYPYRVRSNGEGDFIATFRDIPEAMTEAPTLENLRSMAVDALITAIDFYIEGGKKLPAPTSPEDGEAVAVLPPSVVSKVLLLNTMAEQHCRQADLAKKMGISRQEVTRIVDLRHATKIDTISKALNVLGKRLVISAV
ncbi:MAG: Type II toxin-antitoxin system HicB family antitoxin [Burkholderia sp.]|jgi:antitoxin HicB